MPYGGFTSPNASNFAIVFSSFCVKKTLNSRFYMFIITAQCSHFGGLVLNTFQAVQVSFENLHFFYFEFFSKIGRFIYSFKQKLNGFFFIQQHFCQLWQTHSSTFWCTLTTAYQQWDRMWRSICGGKNI